MATKKVFTVSTMLTLVRIALVPVIVWAILHGNWTLATSLFVVAAMSDMLDGALARLLDERTALGAWLDPLADKLLVLACYGALAMSVSAVVLPTWFIAFIAIKEVVLVLGAAFLGFVCKVVPVHSLVFGKVAMVLQSAYLFLLLLMLSTGTVVESFFVNLQYLVVFAVVAAFMQYAVVGIKSMRLWGCNRIDS